MKIYSFLFVTAAVGFLAGCASDHANMSSNGDSTDGAITCQVRDAQVGSNISHRVCSHVNKTAQAADNAAPPQPVAAPVQRRAAEPGVDGRRDLYLDRRGLGLSGRRHRIA